MRDRGSGAWPCASPALPRSRPRCGELREMASLCSLPFRRLKEGSIWNPGLRPMTQGLCSRGHGSLAPAASERVPPARARLSTCAPRVAIGFKATPENGQAFHRRGDTRTRSLWNPKPHQLSRTPRPSLRFWNLEFVKYSRSSQGQPQDGPSPALRHAWPLATTRPENFLSDGAPAAGRGWLLSMGSVW